MIHKNFTYFACIAAIFLMLKFAYTFATHSDLLFLLSPTDKLICISTNSFSQFIPDIGYYHQSLNIVIEKSCSGFNFWILCFTILSIVVVKYLDSWYAKMMSIPLSLVFAYLLTIFVNASRILFSLFIHHSGISMMDKGPLWMHQAEGTFIYLTYLICIYLLADFLFNLIVTKNEKHSQS